MDITKRIADSLVRGRASDMLVVSDDEGRLGVIFDSGEQAFVEIVEVAELADEEPAEGDDG